MEEDLDYKNILKKMEVKIGEEGDAVEMILPQYLSINIWSIEEENFIKLNAYEKITYPVKDENMLEGVSVSVQKFNMQVTEGETREILFKWANVNEANKLFKDKQEDYLLKIVILD